MDIISVGSWNILKNPDDYDGRAGRSVDEMTGRGLDLVALQEVRIDHADMLCGMFSEKGYGTAILRGTKDHPVRGTDMEHVSEDTVAIAWREDGHVRRTGKARQIGEGQMLAMDFIVHGGGSITMISYHGMWGFSRQEARLREVSTLNRLVGEGSDTHTVIIGGDFNAEPDERAIRYMTGREPGIAGDDWTFWLDAQNVMESLDRGHVHSTTLCGGTGSETNERMGIDPWFMPERVIDHVMTRGYRYGRPGGFVSASVINTDAWVSDHRLLQADIIAPCAPCD